jgi:hypothetical protein
MLVHADKLPSKPVNFKILLGNTLPCRFAAQRIDESISYEGKFRACDL